MGVFAAKVLQQYYKFTPEIEIIDGGTLGIGLINYFSEYDNVIILDTISLDDEVGSIYNLAADELLDLGNIKNTAHEVEVVDMIKSSSLLDSPANITVCAIIPKDIHSVKIGLSVELEKNFDSFLNNAIKLIENLGIEVKKVEDFDLKIIQAL